jgi:hypothetical protein
MAVAEQFWRVALLLVVVGASNPATVGKWLWQRCPTLRCLMQMLVCSQFQFPPPGAATILRQEQQQQGGGEAGGEEGASDEEGAASRTGEGGGLGHGEVENPTESMIEADAELAEREAALVGQLRGEDTRGLKKRKSAAGRRGSRGGALDGFRKGEAAGVQVADGPRLTRSQVVKSDGGKGSKKRGAVPDLMLLDLSMPSRRPPAKVLEQLQELDKELAIGARCVSEETGRHRVFC